ncbi:MAG: peptide chain release factor 1 [Bacillota bacterium]|nr:MAG: peptide chain release factor 1 [Bacillota bacterium]
MFEKLADIEAKYDDLTAKLADPTVLADHERWKAMAKERSRLEPIVEVYRDWRRTGREIEGAEELLETERDADLREMAQNEIETLRARREELEERLTVLLLPRDPNDEKNVVVEIRAGTGGEEAALFAADLYRAYSRYAERQGWRTELLSSTPTDIGGFKEVIFVIEGEGAYSRLKYESGVHRVQRVPETESGGRIHTSTATVAVLPEAEEVEVEISPKDLDIDTYGAGGPGGQHVNKTESAVRIVHIPTGITVTCQDEKSQHKNREKAMRVLRARLLAKAQEEQHEQVARERRSQVGTGDRSERIRTYNFPQTRVTDHRIGLTTHRLPLVLDGDLDELIDALATSAQAEQLRKAE